MAIYSFSIPIDILHKVYQSQEYISSRNVGETRSIITGRILKSAYDEFRTNFEIYRNPAIFLSHRKFMLRCRWLYYLYPSSQPGWNWGSTSTDRFISVMLERHFLDKIPEDFTLKPFDQDMNRTYAIPTFTYYKLVDLDGPSIDIEDFVTKAMVHFLKKYKSFTSKNSTRAVKIYIDDLRWEEITSWKGYGDSAIDRWITFALEDYILDLQKDNIDK